MKLVKISTFAAVLLLCNVNAAEPSTLSLIAHCLSLQSSLASTFNNTTIEVGNGKILGEKANFHFQNLDSGFKGICSDAQFSIEKSVLKSTEGDQHYIFVWSTELGAGSSELSIENVKYSLERPKDIDNWLKEKI